MEILLLWAENKTCVGKVNSLDHFVFWPLWHNSMIGIEDKPIFHQSWYSKGIYTVEWFKDQKALLSLHELRDLFNVNANILALCLQ